MSEPIVHHDIAGKQITVGCTVAMNVRGYVYTLVLGKVTSLTPQKVRIEYIDTRRFGHPKVENTIREPQQLAVVAP